MRPIYEIANDIQKNWKNVSPYAKPYLDAMKQITTINEQYYADSAYSVVMYFLANAAGFRGEDAKRLKAELKAIAK